MKDILEERAEIRYKDIVAKATRKWEEQSQVRENYNNFLKKRRTQQEAPGQPSETEEQQTKAEEQQRTEQ